MIAAWIDGRETDVALASDRGLAYGDGLFETLAWQDRDLLAWPRHLARLERGCRVLGLPAPDGARLRQECRAAASGHERAVVKLLLTRGSGGRGYRPPPAPQVRRFVSVHDWPADANAAGGPTHARLCAHPLGVNERTAGIKHLNRLDQVTACSEWPRGDLFEGLMRDPDGNLVEGTRSNVFIVRGDTVLTPSLARCGVRGIVRDAVIETCTRLGIACAETRLGIDALRHADEVFLTNSVIGVRAVTAIEAYGTIDFEPGPVAAQIARTLQSDGIIA